ncbi:MAG TPA: hypothetical protein PK429_02465 [Candidatus Pacearchaeota archaeon]|jgi:hypothetical protein|nr:hypothetical protein [Candidatus Pacearchaeota archaeon]HPO06807.1 hypothetical protein [Candidatus Pacearchaeota archaeon]
METVFQTGCKNTRHLSKMTNRRDFNYYWKEIISGELSFEDKFELEQAKDDIRNKRFATHEEIMDILRK